MLFFLKRDKQKASGKIPIFCRITINRKEARFGIKKDINPKYWNVQAVRAIGRTDEIVEINTLINMIRASLFNVYNEILLGDTDVTAEKVKNHFLGGAIKDHPLLAQFKRHNEDVKNLIGISKSKAIYQKCEVTRKHLTNFIKEKYNLSDISFKEINHQFITDFEVYLLSTCRLDRVRDIFIFSCFTGLAYIDVKGLSKTDTRTGFGGRLWIMGKRENRS